jgi:hypothetical protein
VAPLLPAPVLSAWEEALRKDDAAGFIEIRQAIADARGDIDGFLALEALRPDWRQDPLKAAERLLAANRLEEALSWVRRKKKGGSAFVTVSNDLDRVRLEARILEALQDRPAAQSVRWAAFETTLDPGILRDYIAKLDDFLEFDELDKAFAAAAANSNAYGALAFFVAWPRRDLAAKRVLDKRTLWEGRHYEALSGAAAILGEEFPLAATVLTAPC